MGHDTVHLDEIEPAGPFGAVRFVRRELGVTAFGINHFTLPPGAAGREHDEKATGQEEVVVVLDGSGALRIDGDEVPLRPGCFVRIDPASTRQPVAGPDGLVFLTIGAPRDAAYEPRGPF